jgi:hypothetical protein
VKFHLQYRVEYGQSLALVGGADALGAWRLADALPMAWSEGDVWRADVELPAGGVAEYKYVVVGAHGAAATWQAGGNSVLALRGGEEEVEVHDNWHNGPGSAVVVRGGPPATREARLLDWASEIEASLGAQRQELRRARLELAAAQEEARAARVDAARARAAAAEADAARAGEAHARRRAEAVSAAVTVQLTETTASFRAALDAAAALLAGPRFAAAPREAAKAAAAPAPTAPAAAAAPAAAPPAAVPAAAAATPAAPANGALTNGAAASAAPAASRR